MCDQVIPSCTGFVDWSNKFGKAMDTASGCALSALGKYCSNECKNLKSKECASCLNKHCPNLADLHKCSKCLGTTGGQVAVTKNNWERCASCGGAGGGGLMPVSDIDSMKMWWIGGGVVAIIAVIVAIVYYKQR